MKIENITAYYSLTQSLPGYCNAKPSLSATAVLEEGDDPDKAMEQLLEILKSKVQAEVDEALERDGQPPKYYDGSRYRVVETQVAFLICPAGQSPHLEVCREADIWYRSLISDRRLETCQDYVEQLVSDKPVFECDGELPAEFLALIEEEKARQAEQEPKTASRPDPYYGEGMYDEGDDWDDEEG